MSPTGLLKLLELLGVGKAQAHDLPPEGEPSNAPTITTEQPGQRAKRIIENPNSLDYTSGEEVGPLGYDDPNRQIGGRLAGNLAAAIHGQRGQGNPSMRVRQDGDTWKAYFNR